MLIPEQTPVYKILFIYYENDTPLCLDYSYTPIDIYPGLTAEILGSRPILNVSVGTYDTTMTVET